MGENKRSFSWNAPAGDPLDDIRRAIKNDAERRRRAEEAAARCTHPMQSRVTANTGAQGCLACGHVW